MSDTIQQLKDTCTAIAGAQAAADTAYATWSALAGNPVAGEEPTVEGAEDVRARLASALQYLTEAGAEASLALSLARQSGRDG